MSSSWVFDQAHYDALNAARGGSVRRVLPELIQRFNLKTALDLGCGLGYYAELLHGFGLQVLGVDGRRENVEEAKKRFPHLEFQTIDAQDPALTSIGKFDLVFCFGLFYHLENPFRVIRSIAEMTAQVTLLEGIVYPSPEPVLVLMDENNGMDQGMNFVAYYPSEPCLVKMLHRSSLAHCYNPSPMPAHDEYRIGPNGFRRRTMIAASRTAIQTPLLTAWPEKSPEFSPWRMMPLFPARGHSAKAYGFVDRLLNAKARKDNRH